MVGIGKDGLVIHPNTLIGGFVALEKSVRNALKVGILVSGFDKRVDRARRDVFRTGSCAPLANLAHNFGEEMVSVAMALNSAKRKRKIRVFDRIGELIKTGHCLFLTLTFKNEVLASTSEETRRKYVRRYLKAQGDVYVANIDFGGERGREHYHAVIAVDQVDLKAWHKYGAIKALRVPPSGTDAERVTKYVAKLSNHALKLTCGVAPRLIYSRLS